MTFHPASRGLLRARAALGVMGLLLTVPAIAVVLSIGTGAPLDPIGSQTRALSRTVDEAERALERAQATLASAGGTLDDAQHTATSTADMTDALSQSMADLATASGVEFLGVRPFASLVPRFSELAKRATSVADALRTTAANLTTSRADLDAMSAEVTSLAKLAGRISTGGSGSGLNGTSLVVGRILLALLLAWMAATAALSVMEARRQLRLPPT